MNPPSSARDARNTVLASFGGWTLDAFDYFVLVFVLSKAAADFHVSVEDSMTLAITATLACRPVGAFLFGLLADRYGRRRPMMWNLVFFSVFEILSGLAPTFGWFLVCRALFGIGMGGEWGVGAALAMEKVPPRWRGVVGGFLQQGYACGYLLAALCFGLLPDGWSWRWLFFIGLLPVLPVFFLLYNVSESSVWEQSRQENWSSLGREIVSHWKLFLYLTILMTAMNFASHGTQDLYPRFLEAERHLPKQAAANVVMIASLGAIIGGIAWGLLSDSIGRRRSGILAFVFGIALIPAWSRGATLTGLAAGAFFMQFIVQGAWGIIPAHITELSPDRVRGMLPGFAYQCGVLLASNAAHLEAQLSKTRTFSQSMALVAAVTFVCGILILLFGPERRAVQFGTNNQPRM